MKNSEKDTLLNAKEKVRKDCAQICIRGGRGGARPAGDAATHEPAKYEEQRSEACER